MAGRNAAQQIRRQSTPRGCPRLPDSCVDPARSVTHPHEDDCVRTSNNLTEKQQEVTEKPPSPGRTSMIFSWLIPKYTNNSSKETEMKLKRELKEKTTLIDELRSNQQAQDHRIRILTIDLDRTCCLYQKSRAVRGNEVRKRKSIIEEKEKDLETEKSHTSQFKAKCLKLEADLEAEKVYTSQFKAKCLKLEADLEAEKVYTSQFKVKYLKLEADLEAEKVHTSQFKAKCLKLEADLEAEKFHTSQFEAKCLKLEVQLALTELKAAQESRMSGSYSDDHANPGMLEGACKAVDKAIETLARFVHNNSVTKVFSLKSPELEQFVHRISPAHPAEFSRPIQMRYVWAHWICRHMFQGFEHVFFDADGGQRTSPLDSKNHALESFQRFQQKQSAFSSDLFQAFCSWKYKSVFPPDLINQALFPPCIICNESGPFTRDEELFALFMDVASAVWLLHELAFSFDPPASILRMARGTPYDKQFHESVMHVEDIHGMSSPMVSLMIRPTFTVRKSIIRSRVFLCDSPNSPTQA